jgi:uncharacterized membrane protein
MDGTPVIIYFENNYTMQEPMVQTLTFMIHRKLKNCTKEEF